MSPILRKTVWLPLILLLLTGVFLVAKSNSEVLGNFAPAMALAFTGSIVLPRRFRIWAPLAVVMLADLAISGANLAGFWGAMTVKWGLLLAAAWWGSRFDARGNALRVLGGCLACSLGFYVAMNTVSWLANPVYAKSLAGWLQANTLGEPGYPPAWLFLRNSVLSDQIFSLVLLALFNTEASWKNLPRFHWKPVSPAQA